MTHPIPSNAPQSGQRVAAAAERLLNTLVLDLLCDVIDIVDDVFLSVMSSSTRPEPGRFNAVVTCTARHGDAVTWSSVRVCPLPQDSSVSHVIGPELNRLGQATLRS